jgi:excisionase family DNA binding protein
VVQRGPKVGEPRYVGVRELARVLGVSRATIYRAVERGELRAVRVSSVIRILVDAPGP